MTVRTLARTATGFRLSRAGAVEAPSAMMRRWAHLNRLPMSALVRLCGGTPSYPTSWTSDMLAVLAAQLGVPGSSTVDSVEHTLIGPPPTGKSSFLRRTVQVAVCPPCLRERPGVYPGMWRLEGVVACQQHRTMLVDTCPDGHLIAAQDGSGRWVGAGWHVLPLHACGANLKGTRPCRVDVSLLAAGSADLDVLDASRAVEEVLTLPITLTAVDWWLDVRTCMGIRDGVRLSERTVARLGDHLPGAVRLRGPVDDPLYALRDRLGQIPHRIRVTPLTPRSDLLIYAMDGD